MDPLSSSPSDKVPFFTVSEDLAPSAPLASSTIIILPFSGLLSPPLKLQTNVSECGGQLWPAGMVLSEYLIRHHLDEMRGKTILELGTGSGLVGLAIALALEQQKLSTSTMTTTATSPSQPVTKKTTIHLTDGMPALIPLISTNIALNNLSDSSSSSSSSSSSTAPTTVDLQASLLPWGVTPLPVEHRSPDIILAADCVYFEPAFPLLEKTIDEAMGGATVLWFCYLKRRKRDAEMLKRLEKLGLEVTEMDTGGLGKGFRRGEGYGRGVGEGRGKGGVVLFEVRRR